MLSSWLATIGLGLDIAGVAILTISVFVSRQRAMDLEGPYWADSPDPPPVKERLRQSRMALIGLPLIVLGFILQIVAVWV